MVILDPSSSHREMINFTSGVRQGAEYANFSAIFGEEKKA